MSDAGAKSVVVYEAKDAFFAEAVMTLLKENEIRAAMDRKWSTAFDGLMIDYKGCYATISVLQGDEKRARELISEFIGEGKENETGA